MVLKFMYNIQQYFIFILFKPKLYIQNKKQNLQKKKVKKNKLEKTLILVAVEL